VIHRDVIAVTRSIETHGRHGDWLAGEVLPTLGPVGQELRVETADMHALATRWGASLGDLNETVAPTGLGLPCQTSATVPARTTITVGDIDEERSRGVAARIFRNNRG
jgi:hypothetical protein